MSNLPIVTVLMPCYNAMPFLTEALDSIIHQTYSNLEILCINDGSTDNTGDVLDKYAQQDSRIRVIHNDENIKLIRSLNKGIELARGAYIARMDADDVSELDRIETQYNFLQQNPTIDIVSTALTMISEEGEVIGEVITRQTLPLSCLFSSFFYVPFHHGPMMSKASVLKENYFLNDPHVLHTEDYELFSRMVAIGVKVQNIRDKAYRVRINSQSVSRQFTDIQDVNFVECARRHNLAFNPVHMSFDVQEVLVNRIDKSKLSVSLLRRSIKHFRQFRNHFKLKHPEMTAAERKEINTIYNTHLFDIIVQSFKLGDTGVRIFAMIQFPLFIRIMLSKRNMSYIKTKRIRD